MQDLQEIIKEVQIQKEYYSKKQKRLKKEIVKYPKGSIQKKVIKGHIYYYLLYRDRGKITHDYLGKKVPPDLNKQVSKRQELESELKTINDKLSILRKFKV